MLVSYNAEPLHRNVKTFCENEMSNFSEHCSFELFSCGLYRTESLVSLQESYSSSPSITLRTFQAHLFQSDLEQTIQKYRSRIRHASYHLHDTPSNHDVLHDVHVCNVSQQSHDEICSFSLFFFTVDRMIATYYWSWSVFFSVIFVRKNKLRYEKESSSTLICVVITIAAPESAGVWTARYLTYTIANTDSCNFFYDQHLDAN